jgi:hypothetical protein
VVHMWEGYNKGMNANTVLKYADDVTFQELEKGGVVTRPDNPASFMLDALGAAFWGMIDGRDPISYHADRLAKNHNLANDMVSAHLVQLAEALAAGGFVEET